MPWQQGATFLFPFYYTQAISLLDGAAYTQDESSLQ